jgi:hypothetical protein
MKVQTVMDRLGRQLEHDYGDGARGIAKQICGIIAEPYNYDHFTRRGDHVDNQLDRINTLLHGYGVEVIRGKHVNNYYGNVNLLYVNMGDTYTTTIIYDTKTDRWICSDWGTLVECSPRRYAE